MDPTLHPITRRTDDFSAFAARIAAGAERVIQEYDCRDGGSYKPDPIIVTKDIDAYLTFHVDKTSPADWTSQNDINDLKRRFFNDVVARTEAEYTAALHKAIGTYEMKIPFDSIVFPKHRTRHVELRSVARYMHFRAAWPGMAAKEWVTVSMPVGDEHFLRIIGSCTPNGYVRDFSLVPTFGPTLERETDYPPSTEFARQLTAMQKRVKAQSLEERIEQLQEELNRLNEEIAELEGN